MRTQLDRHHRPWRTNPVMEAESFNRAVSAIRSASVVVLALLLVGSPMAASAEEPSPGVVPVITSPMLPPGTVGVAYAHQLTANVTPVRFDVSGLPDGLEADTDSGAISGTPTVEGTFTVRLEAISTEPSGGGGSAVRYDVVEIAAAPVTVPVITSPLPPNGTVGVAYSHQLTSNVSPVTFSVTGLPRGLAADAASGLISGTPEIDGTFTVRLEAIGTVPTGGTAQVVYATVIIDPAPAPVITSPPLPGGTVGVPYSFSVTSNTSPVTFSITGLPSGLTADAQSGLISGTPTAEGSYTVRLEAIGTLPTGGTTQVVYYPVVIAPGTGQPPVMPPVFTSTPPTDATVGVAYSFSPDVTSATSVIFTLLGQVPGLSLDRETGRLSGTPTTPGSYDVTIIATNDALEPAALAFTVTVASAGATTLPGENPSSSDSSPPAASAPALAPEPSAQVSSSGAADRWVSSPTAPIARLANTGATDSGPLAAGAAALVLLAAGAALRAAAAAARRRHPVRAA